MLTLTGSVTSTAVADADFNDDGEVDGADLLVWQVGLGAKSGATLADGDANGDGAVNDLDLAVWQSQFPPAEAQVAAGAVPEAGSLTLAFMGLLSVAIGVGRRRSSRGQSGR